MKYLPGMKLLYVGGVGEGGKRKKGKKRGLVEGAGGEWGGGEWVIRLSTKEREHQQLVCERVVGEKKKKKREEGEAGRKRSGTVAGDEGGEEDERKKRRGTVAGMGGGEGGLICVFFHITEGGWVRVSPEVGREVGLRDVLERVGEGWEGEREFVCGENTNFVKKERFQVFDFF